MKLARDKIETIRKKEDHYQGWEYWFVYGIIREACNYLELDMPHFEIDSSFNNCHYDDKENCITIGLDTFSPQNFWTMIGRFIKWRLETYKEKIRFVVYHEIGHLFQIRKHPKWYQYYRRKSEPIKMMLGRDYYLVELDVDFQYRELTIEKNADKIATILFNKFNRKEEEYGI